MKKAVVIAIIGVFAAGMAVAESADQTPAILADLGTDVEAQMLTDAQLAEIAGTGFLEWHPGLLQSLVDFLQAGPGGRAKIIRLHVNFIFDWLRDNA